MNLKKLGDDGLFVMSRNLLGDGNLLGDVVKMVD